MKLCGFNFSLHTPARIRPWLDGYQQFHWLEYIRYFIMSWITMADQSIIFTGVAGQSLGWNKFAWLGILGNIAAIDTVAALRCVLT